MNYHAHVIQITECKNSICQLFLFLPYMLLMCSGIHTLLPMKHHPDLAPGPGLDRDRDPGQGQEEDRYRDQDQEVVAGSVLDLF